MRPSWTGILFLSLISFAMANAQSSPEWHEKKQSASDLEVSGALAGLPADSTRYLTRDELLALPQANFTVTDNTNFTKPARIRRVRLEELVRRLAGPSAPVMVVAICDDAYAAYYPRDYLAAHHAVLVLQVNGEPPSRWPKAAEHPDWDMGPYMISNPKFMPSFKILSHTDEPQIPWGVVRLEFRDEEAVLGAFAPRGPHEQDREVQDGFRIAQQNCIRCHNEGNEGGQKSGRPWDMLGAMAAASPKDFAAYVRAPKSKNPQAQMYANPQYDNATLDALTAYFRTFAQPTKP